MANMDFIESHRLKQVSEDEWESVHPPWHWPYRSLIPGSFTMAQAALAAYQTVTETFTLDNFQANFIRALHVEKPTKYRVIRTHSGKNFATRAVVVEQESKQHMFIIFMFMSATRWEGRSMKHSIERRVKKIVPDISLDFFTEQDARSKHGPFMKLERWPPQHPGGIQKPEQAVFAGVFQITTKLSAEHETILPKQMIYHILGIIQLSDIITLGTPLEIYHIATGVSVPGDPLQKPTVSEVEFSVSLTQSLQFHLHEGFRADEFVYYEASTTWAHQGRAKIAVNYFTAAGKLIATSEQLAFYRLKPENDKSTGIGKISDTKL